MATETEGTAEPLQTVGSALDAQGNDVLARFAAHLVPDKSEQTAGEPKEPEKAPEATPENNGDLSQTAPEAKPDDDDADDLPAATKERIQKRIDKAVAKVKAAEEKAAQLEAEREAERNRLNELEGQLQELKAKQPEKAEAEPSPDNDPLLRVPEIKKIWDKEREANDVYEAAKEYRKRLKRDPAAVLEELSKKHSSIKDVDDAEDFLETVRDNAFRKANDLASTRKLASDRYMRAAQEAQAKEVDEGLKLYPWINDSKAKEQEIAAKYLKQFPSLKGVPKILGRLVAGEMLEGKTPEVKPAPVIPPKALPVSRVQSPAKADDSAEVAELHKQAVRSGGREGDLVALISKRI